MPKFPLHCVAFVNIAYQLSGVTVVLWCVLDVIAEFYQPGLVNSKVDGKVDILECC